MADLITAQAGALTGGAHAAANTGWSQAKSPLHDANGAARDPLIGQITSSATDRLLGEKTTTAPSVSKAALAKSADTQVKLN